MANQRNSLAHTKWMCKYHIVFIPKYRRKVIYNQYRSDLQEIIRTLCKYKGVEILEGHMMPDHVHLPLSIPPKMSVSSFMGYLKGKSALMMFDKHANLKYRFGNRHFWAEGYYVSTVGLNEATIRKYIEDYPSIITAYEVNGYTLYAEEIKKSLGQNNASDLIGHTMYKAPTLPTAADRTTSVRPLPKRQSMVLREYYTPNSKKLSRGNFVADTNGEPAKLYFMSQNNIPKADDFSGGLIALSSNSDNFTDKSSHIEQGYVVCKKPFLITQKHRVFNRSKDNVAERINELKKQDRRNTI